MAEDKISIPVGIDSSGLSADIQKASNQVGKATAGLTRGLATAVGSSLGPFGELIEKADAFKAALTGITGASKLLAGGIAIAGVAAVYGIKEAIDAYKEMRVAIDDAKDANERLKASNEQLPKTIAKLGIAAGEEGRALRKINETIDDLKEEARNKNYSADGDIDVSEESDQERDIRLKSSGYAARLAEAEAAKADILSGAASAQGEARLGNESLSPEARKALEEAAFRKDIASRSTYDLPDLKSALQTALSGIDTLSGQLMTQARAAEFEMLTKQVDYLGRVVKALEERAKAEEDMYDEDAQNLAYMNNATTDKVPTAALAAFVPSTFGVGGYGSIGGGRNIYGGAREGMEDTVKTIGQNVEKMTETLTNPRTLIMEQ